MKRKTNLSPEDNIKDYTVQVSKEQEPDTAKQLINTIQNTQNLPKKEIIATFIELENENHTQFPKKELSTIKPFKEFIFSSKAAWYLITMALSVVATITIFVVPESDVPLAYLRSSFGIIFVLFLPGFALIKALFPAKVPFQTSSDDMDAVERIALSFGMSLALVPMFGLILYFSPWGLGLTSITLSLLVFSIIFATIAVLREHQTKVQTGKSAPNFKTKK